jgi:hypothetical protein
MEKKVALLRTGLRRDVIDQPQGALPWTSYKNKKKRPNALTFGEPSPPKAEGGLFLLVN